MAEDMAEMVSRMKAQEPRKTGWLIHKAGRGWYMPKAQGYTSHPSIAGRFSYDDALSYSHPNGWAGPRDGITIKHEDDITPHADDPALTAAVARADALEAEVERLRGALTDIAEPTRLFSHGDPGVLRSHARAALNAAQAPSRDISRLVEAVRYYADTFCEGFCKDLPRSDTYHESMDDQCSGCKARAALAALEGRANG